MAILNLICYLRILTAQSFGFIFSIRAIRNVVAHSVGEDFSIKSEKILRSTGHRLFVLKPFAIAAISPLNLKILIIVMKTCYE